MTTYRVRPTKPVAVVGVVFGVTVWAIGIVISATRRDDVPLPPLVLWLVFGAVHHGVQRVGGVGQERPHRDSARS